MRLRATITAALVATLIGAPGAAVGLLATPAWAACGNISQEEPRGFTLPKDDTGNWPLNRFGLSHLPAGVDGSGVIVAVLDSGVKASHPALTGKLPDGQNKVLDGRDELEGKDTTHGREDCIGHGTAVASVIAGNARAGFRGIAPGAHILPVRVNENVGGDNEQNVRKTSDDKIANAIDFAVARHADVINLSFAYLGAQADPNQHRVFADAIKRAVAKNIVVVAAVGNDATAKDSFPANQPGVLGVAAMTVQGVRWQDSTSGSFVDVSAPGLDVIAAYPYPGHDTYQAYQGTSVAAPIVAGTVALLKQVHGKEWSVGDYIRQITATADRSPGGKNSPDYGAGVVDPVRAVEDQAAVGPAFHPPAARVDSEDPAVIAARQAAEQRRSKAIWLGIAVVAISVIVLFSSSIIHNGTLRGWRPAE
jgi:membrane-anchored mycosin MYCP